MILIYGSSDDLIEIDGDWQEEFMVTDEITHLALSDGTLLKVTFDGDWNIKIVKGGGMVHQPGSFPFAQAPDYSDVYQNGRDITYVVAGDLRSTP